MIDSAERPQGPDSPRYSSPALAIARLRIQGAGRPERTMHLLTRDEHGTAWRRWKHTADTGIPLHSMLIAPSGRTVLALGASTTEDRIDGGRKRLWVVDTADGHAVRTPFEQHRNAGKRLVYGLSGDDSLLATVLSVADTGRATLTLTISRRPDFQPVAERVLPGWGMPPPTLDYVLQWSPDGRLLALRMREPDGYMDTVYVMDAATLETVHKGDRVTPMGSLSWSSDSAAFAVYDVIDRPRIMHLSDGRLEELPWLRGVRGDPPRQPQVLGLLNGDRALLMRQTRKRARFFVVDLASGEGLLKSAVPLGEHDWPLQAAISRAWDSPVNEATT